MFAHIDYVLQNDSSFVLKNVHLLIDKDYTFQNILNDTALKFNPSNKVQINKINYYWIKCVIKNNTAYDKKYALYTTPNFNNILYYYHEEEKQWLNVFGGELVENNRSTFDYLPCVLPANKTTTLYMKVDVRNVNTSEIPMLAGLKFKNHENVVSNRLKTYQLWLATTAIVLAFFVYNAFWFFLTKELVYIYYLIILAGSLVYITCFNFFISLFTAAKRLNASVLPDGSVDYLPLEFMILQISVLFIMIGLVQFTRVYLKTKMHFFVWDKILKISFVIYSIYVVAITTLEFALILRADNTYALINNLILIGLILNLIGLGIKSYTKKVAQAKYYLLAMLLPLLIMLALVVYLVIYQNHVALYTLPNIAILSITITFAVALVARVNLIKDELNAEKMAKQAQAISIDLEKERNKRLEEKIAHHQIELKAAQKTKLLMKELHHRVKNNLQIVSSLLSLQSLRTKDTAVIDAIKEGQHRVEAMSLIHQRLYVQDNLTHVNVKEFIPDIAESLMLSYGYNYDNFKLELDISEELIDVDKAIPLSIILNELITNAFKYAYCHVENPILKISLSKPNQNMALIIADNGQGIDLENWHNHAGYGKELVETFTKQLDGTVQLSINNGTVFTIVFPFY